MATFAPTAVRASELARCARMAALRGLGAEQQEYDEQTRRYFARGHLYTDYVCRQLEAKHGRENVQREVVIPWPLGEGHADAYITTEKLLVEIKSTATPSTSSPMFDMAVEQLRIYLRFHPEAERGALYLINPSDLRGEDMFEVRLTDDDRERIDEAVDEIRQAVEHGSEGHEFNPFLPERVCAKPSQARSRLCPFADACFAGWEPPDTPTVTDPEAVNAAALLARIKRDEREHKERLAGLEEERRQVQDALVELVPVGESTVGPWKVTRTHVKRSPSFSMKAAAAAGFPVHTLDEFLRPGAEYDTFRVAAADEAGDVDYGEAPF